MHDFPWPEGCATAIGSHPGDDPAEASRIVLGELPLPYLPELPARGPGADLVGRTAGLLVDLPVETRPSGWRFADQPGRDLVRGHGLLSGDLDALEEHAQEHEGPLKIQIAGPWTLAGSIELPYGDKALADPGAVRDLVASLTEGVAAHIADVRRRLPGTTVLLQIDEPGLPGVLAGTVPTASGFGRLRAVEASVAEDGLRRVIADHTAIVHCCAPEVPYGLVRAAGAAAASVDARLIRRADEDTIAEAVEAGFGFFMGVVPGVDATLPKPAESLRSIRDLWHRLGLPAVDLPRAVVITPACGLAGASPGYARAALEHCREAAHILAESPEG